MKRILIFILLLIGLQSYAQQTSSRYLNGRVVHTQVGGGPGSFDVSCNFLDEAGYFDGTNVSVNDFLFVSDGGFGYYLPITTILTSAPSTVVIRVSGVGLPIATVPTGIGYITRGSPKFKFTPYISGMSQADQQVSSENFMYTLDSILKYKLVERTSGSTPPAYTPTSNDSWIAQNASGDVYKFNGVTWSLVGGLVTTVSPLSGNGTAINPVKLNNSGVVQGSYGTSTIIPRITVDSFGRITNIVNQILTDTSITNEGRLGVGGTGTTTRVINSNTSGNVGVSIVAGTGMSLSATNSSNGGSITFNNTGDLLTTNEGNLSLFPFGANGGRITSNTSGSGSPKFVGTGNTTITVNNDTMFINTTSGISSVFTNGIIIGDGTTGNRIRLDTTGLGDNEYFMVYNGSAWGAGTILTGGGIIGEGTSTDPLQLDDFGATIGQTIKWNGAAWIAANDSIGFNPSTALGGDLSGTLPNPNVVKIQNIPVSTTDPTLNQILKFNGTEYIPAVDTFRWSLKAPNGTSTTPSYTFENSQGTGLYAIQGTIPRVFLIGASSTSTTRGTGINLTAGSNSSTGIGGTITMAGGNSASGAAGAINFNAGSASSSGTGGAINLTAGNSTNTNAGNILLNGGFGNFGGGISLTAGLSTGTNQDGPQVNIFGGAAGPNGRGGDIIFTAGTGFSDTTRNGRVILSNGTGLVLFKNDKSHLATMPNKLVGQMIYTTKDTASNGKIGNVRIWNGTEWLPLYTPENTGLTVAAGTDSTSIIQTTIAGTTPITLKASKDLIISESGNTITLSSNPDVYEFNGWNAFTEECELPSIVPDPLHGPFFAKDISPECGNIYQWNHYTEAWGLWNFFTGNITLNPPNTLTYVNSLGNVSPTSESYHSGNGAFYFRVPISRRTSDRAPYTAGNDGAAMYAYHLNGTQHTEMRIASYGAGFDLHVEDHNQNESYATYSTTYRSSATPGSYRAPAVGDLMFNSLIRITRGNSPSDPYEDACGYIPWDIKVASVGASNNVGTNVNFYTRKSTDPQSISGTGNLTLQLKENQDIRAVNYQLRNDPGTPIYIAGFNPDGTFRSDLLSEISITETLGIDTDLGAPDGAILTWNSASEEWEGTQLSYQFEEANYSATAGATSFTMPITPATPTGAKMPIRVYRNGVKLIYTSGAPNVHQFSYTASTLTTSPCSAGDIISIEYLNY